MLVSIFHRHAIQSFNGLVVLSGGLLLKQLGRHLSETTRFNLLFLHVGKLRHIQESTIQNYLSLRIHSSALHHVILNPTFVLQCIEQALRIPIHITQDYSSISLTISQCKLLQSYLILLRHANRDGKHRVELLHRHLGWTLLLRFPSRW